MLPLLLTDVGNLQPDQPGRFLLLLLVHWGGKVAIVYASNGAAGVTTRVPGDGQSV